MTGVGVLGVFIVIRIGKRIRLVEELPLFKIVIFRFEWKAVGDPIGAFIIG